MIARRALEVLTATATPVPTDASPEEIQELVARGLLRRLDRAELDAAKVAAGSLKELKSQIEAATGRLANAERGRSQDDPEALRDQLTDLRRRALDAAQASEILDGAARVQGSDEFVRPTAAGIEAMGGLRARAWRGDSLALETYLSETSRLFERMRAVATNSLTIARRMTASEWFYEDPRVRIASTALALDNGYDFGVRAASIAEKNLTWGLWGFQGSLVVSSVLARTFADPREARTALDSAHAHVKSLGDRDTSGDAAEISLREGLAGAVLAVRSVHERDPTLYQRLSALKELVKPTEVHALARLATTDRSPESLAAELSALQRGWASLGVIEAPGLRTAEAILLGATDGPAEAAKRFATIVRWASRIAERPMVIGAALACVPLNPLETIDLVKLAMRACDSIRFGETSVEVLTHAALIVSRLVPSVPESQILTFASFASEAEFASVTAPFLAQAGGIVMADYKLHPAHSHVVSTLG